jgi:hypothetical protein
VEFRGISGDRIMMRTIEILLVIIIITGAFITSSFFAVLPQPRQVSPLNLRRLALTTLQTLDAHYDLSETVFKSPNDPAWGALQTALSACLPPNIVYNLTVYEVLSGGTGLYAPTMSISNAQSLGTGSDASSYLVASSNVTFSVTPEKIGEHGSGGTLYILNCSDANSWWITGYTDQSLAADLYNLLCPYFQNTIMVNSTTQLGQILNGTAFGGETLQNAVVINTCGEAVPIPQSYATLYSGDSYAQYCYQLGIRVHQYNWTWVSIVGYPLYYVSNTAYDPIKSSTNTWGIYGMICVGAGGLNAFLEGIDNQGYSYNSAWITGDSTSDAGLASVSLSSDARYYCDYYGIYPSAYQTSTRALPSSILSQYHLTVISYILNQVDNWIPGAVYRNNVSGSFLALGLTRTPDIRLTALGLLDYYKPRLYRSEYTAAGTSMLVVLQLGQVGGV